MTASGAARLCAEQNFVRSAALGCIKVPTGASKSEIPAKTHLNTVRLYGNQASHGDPIGHDELEACRIACQAILKAVIAALP